MKTYQVYISQPAMQDLQSIMYYIGKELKEPGIANNLIENIQYAVMGLNQLPTRHALVADERLARNGIRQIPVKNYIVFYIVNEADSAVTVVRILYGQRNWIDLL
ncbi:MAG: type II toxin-antitoxin system RelE/ParE family toxin [Firmicutes bacterium HGW-Firmicutes-15]|nr:MAG: type II toxin-antitoxin system RelE/ParE family toxin [Firmicutes bacterium HGW-Firmicutes-15]